MFNWLKSKSIALKTLGQLGEEFAQAEYKKRGFKIIAANFFNKKVLRLGEIDFIAKNKQKLIFVEVKTRTESTNKFGSAAEAVNSFKQIKILKAVKIFLQKNPELAKLQPQIDVCLVLQNQLDKNSYSATIIPNAVEDWN